jgi:hypothetical protein
MFSLFHEGGDVERHDDRKHKALKSHSPHRAIVHHSSIPDPNDPSSFPTTRR